MLDRPPPVSCMPLRASVCPIPQSCVCVYAVMYLCLNVYLSLSTYIYIYVSMVWYVHATSVAGVPFQVDTDRAHDVFC